MRISDWSSDVCSSDLDVHDPGGKQVFDIIGDLLPAGVVNIVNGFGIEAGAPLAQHKRIRKVAFTGETTTGRLIMQYASQNPIGKASCRESVCQYGYISVVAVSLKKKKPETQNH